jgi:hypothetical protein
MARYRLLWRFVIAAPTEAEGHEAAAALSARLGVTLPPVRRYEVDGEWMTDTVTEAEAGNLAVALGRTLALAGRVGPEWLVAALSHLDEDGTCFATFTATERNPPAVAGVTWGLAELWQA